MMLICIMRKLNLGLSSVSKSEINPEVTGGNLPNKTLKEIFEYTKL